MYPSLDNVTISFKAYNGTDYDVNNAGVDIPHYVLMLRLEGIE
jgi:hypothetical protein